MPCRYLAFGSSMDYMYQELHVAYPLTIEVGWCARCRPRCPGAAPVPPICHAAAAGPASAGALARLKGRCGPVQVYGPQGLGKTAMGGHPRLRRLSQAAGRALPDAALPQGASSGSARSSMRAEGLPVLAAGGADVAEGDGDLAQEAEEGSRRTQLLQDAVLGVGDAPAKKGLQAFRTNPGLLDKVCTCGAACSYLGLCGADEYGRSG